MIHREEIDDFGSLYWEDEDEEYDEDEDDDDEDEE